MSPSTAHGPAALDPFPLELPVSTLPSKLEASLGASVQLTPLYQAWSAKLANAVDQERLTALTAKNYRGKGLQFLCYLIRTQADPSAVEASLASESPHEHLERLLLKAMKRLDLATIVAYFRSVEQEENRNAVHQVRNILLNHLLPWAYKNGFSELDPREYDRRKFRVERSLDDHMARRNELLLEWNGALEGRVSSDTAENYRNVVRAYLRHLREQHLDPDTHRQVREGALHPSRALNELIVSNPYERIRDYLKGFRDEAGERARSIILNDFYAHLHAERRTKFNPAAYPRGTFFPALPVEEAIVRESTILTAWAEHIREDRSIGADAGENYVRCVARYMFYLRDSELMKKTGKKGSILNPEIKNPQRALERLVLRDGPEARLADFLGSVRSDTSIGMLRWLLADKFYPWLRKADYSTTFNRERFEQLF